jgi:hypothetical protein
LFGFREEEEEEEEEADGVRLQLTIIFFILRQ